MSTNFFFFSLSLGDGNVEVCYGHYLHCLSKQEHVLPLFKQELSNLRPSLVPKFIGTVHACRHQSPDPML